MEKKKTTKPRLNAQEKAAIEYNRKLKENDYVAPEKLQGKSVFDVLTMDEFFNTMKTCIGEQLQLRQAFLDACEKMKKEGKRVPVSREPIDRVRECGLMDVGEFILEYAKVLNKQSKQPREIRDYVSQLGRKAYVMTVEKMIQESDPEMKKLFDKATKTKKN